MVPVTEVPPTTCVVFSVRLKEFALAGEAKKSPNRAQKVSKQSFIAFPCRRRRATHGRNLLMIIT